MEFKLILTKICGNVGKDTDTSNYVGIGQDTGIQLQIQEQNYKLNGTNENTDGDCASKIYLLILIMFRNKSHDYSR